MLLFAIRLIVCLIFSEWMGTMTEGNFIEPEQNLSASRLVLLLGFFFLLFERHFHICSYFFFTKALIFFEGFCVEDGVPWISTF